MDELERELFSMVTSELGELRIMVCRSKLCSDRGELGGGRFLLGRDGSRGLGKREPVRTWRGRVKEIRGRKQTVLQSHKFTILLLF